MGLVPRVGVRLLGDRVLLDRNVLQIIHEVVDLLAVTRATAFGSPWRHWIVLCLAPTVNEHVANLVGTVAERHIVDSGSRPRDRIQLLLSVRGINDWVVVLVVLRHQPRSSTATTVGTMALRAVEAIVFGTEQLLAAMDTSLVETKNCADLSTRFVEPVQRKRQGDERHRDERPSKPAVKPRSFEHLVVGRRLSVGGVEKALDSGCGGAAVLEDDIHGPHHQCGHEEDERYGSLGWKCSDYHDQIPWRSVRTNGWGRSDTAT